MSTPALTSFIFPFLSNIGLIVVATRRETIHWTTGGVATVGWLTPF